MHTRKRAVAGAVVGALGLGMLAMSPSGASATVYAGEDTAVTYLVGSKAEVDLGGYEEAYVTRVSGNIGQFGWGYVAADDEYLTDPSWLTLSGSTSISIDNDANGGDEDTLDGIGVTATSAGSVTVTPYEDFNLNGVPDNGEDIGDTITVSFVDFSSTTLVAVPSSSLVAKGAATGFAVALLSGLTPVERDDAFGDGPHPEIPPFNAFITLPGEDEVAVNALPTNAAVFAGLLTPEQAEQYISIYPIADVGEVSGTASIRAYHDPTGLDEGGVPTAAAKTAAASFAISSQVFNEEESNLVVTGTGVIAPEAGDSTYTAPLTTTTTTWTWTLVDFDPDAETPAPMANASVVVDFYGFDEADQFKLNGGTADSLPDTVTLKTNAQGKLVVNAQYVTANGKVPDGTYFGAQIVKVNGADVSGPYAEVDYDAAGYLSSRFSTLSMVAPAGISIPAGTEVPITGPFGVSVPSGSLQTFKAVVKDTLGNPVGGAQALLITTVGPRLSTTNASGVATFTIPGQTAPATVYVLGLTASIDEQDVNLGDYGVQIDFKTAAQLAAGTITADVEPPGIGRVTPDGGPLYDAVQVIFNVGDSNGDAMDLTAGLLSVKGGVAYLADPMAPEDLAHSDDHLTIADGKSVTANVTQDGYMSVWLASDTVGPVTVTLSIGGKTKSATANFFSLGPITDFSIAPAAGGEVPESVPSNTKVPMVVSAKDANGNPVGVPFAGAAIPVQVNVIGDAANDSGGQESVLLLGPSGTASFNVRSGAYGSFEVVASLETGFFFMGVAGDGGPEWETLTATTGEIEISGSLTIRGERISAKKVEVTGKAKGFAPGSEITVKFTKANGEVKKKTVEVDENQRYTAKAKVGKKTATVKAIGDGNSSKKIKV